MEFAKAVAIAPTAPTAPPSYEASHQNATFKHESFQQQSAYPHPHPQPQPTNIVHNPYPTHNQQGSYQPYQRPGQVVITQAPITIVRQPDYTNSIAPLGDQPSMTRCMRCNTQIVTNVEYYNSGVTHCLGAVLCLTAWYCCCCFVPYCVNGTKNVRHYCPQCKTLIGSYERQMC